MLGCFVVPELKINNESHLLIVSHDIQCTNFFIVWLIHIVRYWIIHAILLDEMGTSKIRNDHVIVVCSVNKNVRWT